MPKRKKKSKIKKGRNKKRVSKVSRKNSKRKKIIKRKSKTKKDQKSLSSELIFKTKQEWIKNSLANKSQYQNKYNESIKNNNAFWKKEGKESHGLNHIRK